jgi:hypothetical protein
MARRKTPTGARSCSFVLLIVHALDRQKKSTDVICPVFRHACCVTEPAGVCTAEDVARLEVGLLAAWIHLGVIAASSVHAQFVT